MNVYMCKILHCITMELKFEFVIFVPLASFLKPSDIEMLARNIRGHFVFVINSIPFTLGLG